MGMTLPTSIHLQMAPDLKQSDNDKDKEKAETGNQGTEGNLRVYLGSDGLTFQFIPTHARTLVHKSPDALHISCLPKRKRARPGNGPVLRQREWLQRLAAGTYLSPISIHCLDCNPDWWLVDEPRARDGSVQYILVCTVCQRSTRFFVSLSLSLSVIVSILNVQIANDKDWLRTATPKFTPLPRSSDHLPGQSMTKQSKLFLALAH